MCRELWPEFPPEIKRNLLEKKQFTFICKKILVTLYKQKAAGNKLCYTDKKKDQYLSIAIQNYRCTISNPFYEYTNQANL